MFFLLIVLSNHISGVGTKNPCFWFDFFVDIYCSCVPYFSLFLIAHLANYGSLEFHSAQDFYEDWYLYGCPHCLVWILNRYEVFALIYLYEVFVFVDLNCKANLISMTSMTISQHYQGQKCNKNPFFWLFLFIILTYKCLPIQINACNTYWFVSFDHSKYISIER